MAVVEQPTLFRKSSVPNIELPSHLERYYSRYYD